MTDTKTDLTKMTLEHIRQDVLGCDALRKTCTKCKMDKDFLCYSKDLRGKRGIKSSCKECNRQMSKNYYLTKKLNQQEVVKIEDEKYQTCDII